MGSGEPLVWYEGSGTTDRRFLSADERGSIVAVTDGSGTLLAANSYDEYGIPGSGNVGRFQYTGQAWLPELGMYHYKNRIYSPTLGRFLQTDLIGFEGGINLYAYVGNDPVNSVDPLGLTEQGVQPGQLPYGKGPQYDLPADIIVTGPRMDWVAFNDARNLFDSIKNQFDRLRNAAFGPERGIGGGKGGNNGKNGKKLPRCLQNFLRGRIAGNPANITFHDGGGGPPNWFDNSVTYRSDIYLAEGMFGRTDRNAIIHKFHEIGHVSQNARMGLNSFDHFATYLGFGGHDASPFEQAADDFAKATYDAYKDAGLNNTCPF